VKLFSLSKAIGSGWLAALALPLFAVGTAGAEEPEIVLANVRIVDVTRGEVLSAGTVVVRAGKIAEIRSGERGYRHETRPGSVVLDASGMFLIPGLWDMHAHIRDPEREFRMLVANGVLGIRDMGGEPEKIFRWREQAASGALQGPRIVACGPIVDGPEPSNPPISVVVRDAAEGRAIVEKLKTMGADCVKVHDRVPLDAYRAIADQARRSGLPLVGHIPVRVPTLAAVEAGQRSVEHQIGLRGASLAEREVMEAEAKQNVIAEAMKKGDFSLIPEAIARKGSLLLDRFDSRRAQELYRAFVKHGTYLDPTLVTQYALTFVDELSRREDPRMKYIPAAEREYWKPEKGMLTRYRTPAYIAYRKREFAKTLEQIPVARRAGVSFVAGTDMWLPYVYPGFSTHDEMALFVQAGLSPIEALRTATLNPARLLRLESSTGSIRTGMAADLVLLAADPLKDIANTKKIAAVILRGKLLRRADLDELLREAEAAAKAGKD
jgi:imidazolonepropionase-like amidohydrolase